MYNPQAGDESLHLKDLVSSLEKKGAEVIAQCTKTEDYEKALKISCDFIMIAGGDGTIEKVTKHLIHNPLPISILPFGNANNIATSLDVDTALDKIIQSWKNKDFTPFSVGSVKADNKLEYFLESVGWGLFAKMLSEKKAQKKKKKFNKKTDKVESGLTKLVNAVENLQATYYEVVLDGMDYSGHYLWLEVMNTNSMGPQLVIAPEANSEDEFLDVVLVKEEEREKLEQYLNQQNFTDFSPATDFLTFRAKNIKVSSSEPIHIDDEIIQPKLLGLSSSKWVEVGLLPHYFQVINS